MPLTKTTKTCPADNEVIFFTSENYGGDAYLSNLGDKVDIYNEYFSLNDRLNSVRVGASCEVIAYKDAYFAGVSQTIVSDTSKIDVGGMSSFNVLDKDEESADSFSFKGRSREGRRVEFNLRF